MRTVVCPGSFDPITLGHLDVIERAAALFDKVVVCVMVNGGKNSGMFTGEERLELVKLATEHLGNVEAVRCDGLLAEFAKAQGACALVKGARTGSDFDWEIQLAQINRDLCPELDTVILPARPEHLHISSTMVREMIRYHQKLDDYIPAGTAELLQKLREGTVR